MLLMSVSFTNILTSFSIHHASHPYRLSEFKCWNKWFQNGCRKQTLKILIFSGLSTKASSPTTSSFRFRNSLEKSIDLFKETRSHFLEREEVDLLRGKFFQWEHSMKRIAKYFWGRVLITKIWDSRLRHLMSMTRRKRIMMSLQREISLRVP